MNNNLHIPVLAREIIEYLNLKKDGVYLDATFGRGGHSSLILQNLGDQGKLFAFDRDIDAILHGRENIQDERLILINKKFSLIKELPNLKLDGIIADLGVSLPQLKIDKRGFSFLLNGPLDMRMDNSTGKTLAEYLKATNEVDLANIIYDTAEEKYSRKIATNIIESSQSNGISSTHELKDIILNSIPSNTSSNNKIKILTRTFLALRILVNDELGELRELLKFAPYLLNKNGRLLIITFHSTEDRIVKQAFKKLTSNTVASKHATNQILNTTNKELLFKLIPKIRPTASELISNKQSHSAILRMIERI